MGKGELGTIEHVYGTGTGVPVDAADVEKWVAELPLSIREFLARGPVDEDATHAKPCCTICRAANRVAYQGRQLAALDLLALWHAQAHVSVDGPMHPGDALGSYLRCLHIYLLAGWDGVHRTPDTCLACESCGRFYPIEHTDVTYGSDCCDAYLLVVEFEGEGDAQRIVWPC